MSNVEMIRISLNMSMTMPMSHEGLGADESFAADVSVQLWLASAYGFNTPTSGQPSTREQISSHATDNLSTTSIVSCRPLFNFAPCFDFRALTGTMTKVRKRVCATNTRCVSADRLDRRRPLMVT
ncbi:hypothetical protein THAOC_11799 [Thalassiosira oceanica]|uniref:Uncharacterized protein n=1 Tax=Thalassiosira oceanica TaxID=159749 RepID=K0SPI6_THAOC|nr:hypothetical protein THAOC_11799 [Thalassiosira oceanica]|eukprot:EJK67200.1 hypothetical protein THAOC_11799 [Thalassiosira oceanica]